MRSKVPMIGIVTKLLNQFIKGLTLGSVKQDLSHGSLKISYIDYDGTVALETLIKNLQSQLIIAAELAEKEGDFCHISDVFPIFRNHVGQHPLCLVIGRLITNLVKIDKIFVEDITLSFPSLFNSDKTSEGIIDMIHISLTIGGNIPKNAVKAILALKSLLPRMSTKPSDWVSFQPIKRLRLDKIQVNKIEISVKFRHEGLANITMLLNNISREVKHETKIPENKSQVKTNNTGKKNSKFNRKKSNYKHFRIKSSNKNTNKNHHSLSWKHDYVEPQAEFSTVETLKIENEKKIQFCSSDTVVRRSKTLDDFSINNSYSNIQSVRGNFRPSMSLNNSMCILDNDRICLVDLEKPLYSRKRKNSIQVKPHDANIIDGSYNSLRNEKSKENRTFDINDRSSISTNNSKLKSNTNSDENSDKVGTEDQSVSNDGPDEQPVNDRKRYFSKNFYQGGKRVVEGSLKVFGAELEQARNRMKMNMNRSPKSRVKNRGLSQKTYAFAQNLRYRPRDSKTGDDSNINVENNKKDRKSSPTTENPKNPRKYSPNIDNTSTKKSPTIDLNNKNPKKSSPHGEDRFKQRIDQVADGVSKKLSHGIRGLKNKVFNSEELIGIKENIDSNIARAFYRKPHDENSSNRHEHRFRHSKSEESHNHQRNDYEDHKNMQPTNASSQYLYGSASMRTNSYSTDSPLHDTIINIKSKSSSGSSSFVSCNSSDSGNNNYIDEIFIQLKSLTYAYCNEDYEEIPKHEAISLLALDGDKQVPTVNRGRWHLLLGSALIDLIQDLTRYPFISVTPNENESSGIILQTDIILPWIESLAAKSSPFKSYFSQTKNSSIYSPVNKHNSQNDDNSNIGFNLTPSNSIFRTSSTINSDQLTSECVESTIERCVDINTWVARKPENLKRKHNMKSTNNNHLTEQVDAKWSFADNSSDIYLRGLDSYDLNLATRSVVSEDTMSDAMKTTNNINAEIWSAALTTGLQNSNDKISLSRDSPYRETNNTNEKELKTRKGFIIQEPLKLRYSINLANVRFNSSGLEIWMATTKNQKINKLFSIFTGSSSFLQYIVELQKGILSDKLTKFTDSIKKVKSIRETGKLRRDENLNLDIAKSLINYFITSNKLSTYEWECIAQGHIRCLNTVDCEELVMEVLSLYDSLSYHHEARINISNLVFEAFEKKIICPLPIRITVFSDTVGLSYINKVCKNTIPKKTLQEEFNNCLKNQGFEEPCISTMNFMATSKVWITIPKVIIKSKNLDLICRPQSIPQDATDDILIATPAIDLRWIYSNDTSSGALADLYVALRISGIDITSIVKGKPNEIAPTTKVLNQSSSSVWSTLLNTFATVELICADISNRIPVIDKQSNNHIVSTFANMIKLPFGTNPLYTLDIAIDDITSRHISKGFVTCYNLGSISFSHKSNDAIFSKLHLQPPPWWHFVSPDIWKAFAAAMKILPNIEKKTKQNLTTSELKNLGNAIAILIHDKKLGEKLELPMIEKYTNNLPINLIERNIVLVETRNILGSLNRTELNHVTDYNEISSTLETEIHIEDIDNMSDETLSQEDLTYRDGSGGHKKQNDVSSYEQDGSGDHTKLLLNTDNQYSPGYEDKRNYTNIMDNIADSYSNLRNAENNSKTIAIIKDCINKALSTELDEPCKQSDLELEEHSIQDDIKRYLSSNSSLHFLSANPLKETVDIITKLSKNALQLSLASIKPEIQEFLDLLQRGGSNISLTNNNSKSCRRRFIVPWCNNVPNGDAWVAVHPATFNYLKKSNDTFDVMNIVEPYKEKLDKLEEENAVLRDLLKLSFPNFGS